MGTIIEINNCEISVSGKGTTWARLTGTDGRGHTVYAVAFEEVAKNIMNHINDRKRDGELIADLNLYIDLDGFWKETNKQKTDRNGNLLFREDNTPIMFSNFNVQKFKFMEGPVVDLLKMRRLAYKIFQEAEDLRSTGNIRSAYNMVADFVAKLSHRPYSPVEEVNFIEDASEFDALNPETLAASIYDGKNNSEKIELEKKVGIVEEKIEEQHSEELVKSNVNETIVEEVAEVSEEVDEVSSFSDEKLDSMISSIFSNTGPEEETSEDENPEDEIELGTLISENEQNFSGDEKNEDEKEVANSNENIVEERPRHKPFAGFGNRTHGSFGGFKKH